MHQRRGAISPDQGAFLAPSETLILPHTKLHFTLALIHLTPFMTHVIPGKITISPNVLTTIVTQTALDANGVRALGARAPQIVDVKGQKAAASGVEVVIQGTTVYVALNVDVTPDANMMTLAETLQRDIARNIEHILGMQVARVDVTIGDIAFS